MKVAINSILFLLYNCTEMQMVQIRNTTHQSILSFVFILQKVPQFGEKLSPQLDSYQYVSNFMTKECPHNCISGN